MNTQPTNYLAPQARALVGGTRRMREAPSPTRRLVRRRRQTRSRSCFASDQARESARQTRVNRHAPRPHSTSCHEPRCSSSFRGAPCIYASGDHQWFELLLDWELDGEFEQKIICSAPAHWFCLIWFVKLHTASPALFAIAAHLLRTCDAHTSSA